MRNEFLAQIFPDFGRPSELQISVFKSNAHGSRGLPRSHCTSSSEMQLEWFVISEFWYLVFSPGGEKKCPLMQIALHGKYFHAFDHNKELILALPWE